MALLLSIPLAPSILREPALARDRNVPGCHTSTIAGLLRLESLQIVHLPHTPDLEPLRHLIQLKSLSLETLPSWDSSGKVTEVKTLAPLAELPRLESLQLFGVRPPDRKVDDLLRIASLRDARISKYPKEEIARLNEEMVRRSPG